jgi:DMSO/TMAO reductase YedYZ molybdopterin-dependent catalytic subunit
VTTESDEDKREGLVRVAPKPKMARAEPVLEWPLPLEESTDFVTPSDKLFVLAHLGVPEIELQSWKLDVAGLVRSPQSFGYDDLQRFTPITIRAAHQCAGNPFDPAKPGRTIANVVWRGVLLREILQQADVMASCRYLWAYGLDYGTFYSAPYQEHYVKDLPMEYVMSENVIVATHLNGEPLSLKHGFPARVVAPGFYGTNSVKWLCRLQAADRRANGYFTKELYNDPAVDGSGPKPVWEIEPESVIVGPANEGLLNASATQIWGWAWSPSEIDSVEISTDGGESWGAASVERKQQACWQRFQYAWLPSEAGRHEVMSRATDRTGRTQPMDGARNAVHKITCTVGKG